MNFLVFHIYLYFLLKETQKQKEQAPKFSKQAFNSSFWKSFLKENWYKLGYLLRCRFSPVCVGLIVGFKKSFEDWTHHGIIFWLKCCCHWRCWGLLMRRTGSCHVDFIVKAIIHFIDSDHIRLSFSSSPSQEFELSGFSESAVLLVANILALCEEVSWVTASVNLLTYSIWHFEYSRSWVPIEVRVLCKTFVKELNVPLLLSMISLVARELGLEKRSTEFCWFPADSSAMLTQ